MLFMFKGAVCEIHRHLRVTFKISKARAPLFFPISSTWQVSDHPPHLKTSFSLSILGRRSNVAFPTESPLVHVKLKINTVILIFESPRKE